MAEMLNRGQGLDPARDAWTWRGLPSLPTLRPVRWAACAAASGQCPC